jgi:GGDEF domain-containing protein
VSVGISVYPVDGTDAETLLNNADMALIHAKNRGAGKYQFFEKI